MKGSSGVVYSSGWTNCTPFHFVSLGISQEAVMVGGCIILGCAGVLRSNSLAVRLKTTSTVSFPATPGMTDAVKMVSTIQLVCAYQDGNIAAWGRVLRHMTKQSSRQERTVASITQARTCTFPGWRDGGMAALSCLHKLPRLVFSVTCCDRCFAIFRTQCAFSHQSATPSDTAHGHTSKMAKRTASKSCRAPAIHHPVFPILQW